MFVCVNPWFCSEGSVQKNKIDILFWFYRLIKGQASFPIEYGLWDHLKTIVFYNMRYADIQGSQISPNTVEFQTANTIESKNQHSHWSNQIVRIKSCSFFDFLKKKEIPPRPGPELHRIWGCSFHTHNKHVCPYPISSRNVRGAFQKGRFMVTPKVLVLKGGS